MPVRHAVSGVTFAIVAGSLLLAAPARATVEFQKKAKEAGITSVTNCQSCHVAKLPKKTEHELNEMGNWLVAQKETRKAKAIDVAWLKDYKPAVK